MGVDFYQCDSCKESRYEEYVAHCSGCGHRVCTACVVNDDINSKYAYEYGVKFDNSPEQREEFGIVDGYEIGDIIDDTGVASKYCPFCNGEKVSNDDILDYLLERYNLSKEEVKKQYLETR